MIVLFVLPERWRTFTEHSAIRAPAPSRPWPEARQVVVSTRKGRATEKHAANQSTRTCRTHLIHTGHSRRSYQIRVRKPIINLATRVQTPTLPPRVPTPPLPPTAPLATSALKGPSAAWLGTSCGRFGSSPYTSAARLSQRRSTHARLEKQRVQGAIRLAMIYARTVTRDRYVTGQCQIQS